ncbi:MAG: thiamine ABC transporter substrate-binding protein [Candidatus Heimdallarchaeaceae archaeon]
MKKIAILVILLCIITSNSPTMLNPTEAAISDYDLTIYTYESLLADPGYDFIGGFSNYSGIPENRIRVVLLDDANSIVTKASLEKDNPVADVLIGIDNILIHKAKEEQLLQAYSPPNIVNVSEELITNLDPEKYVVPYDYGIIALWYSNSRINVSSNPELTNLTLQDILDYDLDKKMVVEDPTLSSPGLGFLLWTIAVYGDPKINFEGLLGQDWRVWWDKASKDLRIAASWGSAFNIYYEEEEGRPIMVSYGTSPAYDVCHPIWGVGLGAEQPSYAIVSHEKNRKNAWLQIEGLGLVKDAPHPETGKQFINWFLSEELQNNIATNNWMYPANMNANVSDCFLNVAINPKDVDVLNDILPPSMIKENLDMWKSDWESQIVSFSPISFVILSLAFIAIASIGVRKVRTKK